MASFGHSMQANILARLASIGSRPQAMLIYCCVFNVTASQLFIAVRLMRKWLLSAIKALYSASTVQLHA